MFTYNVFVNFILLMYAYSDPPHHGPSSSKGGSTRKVYVSFVLFVFCSFCTLGFLCCFTVFILQHSKASRSSPPMIRTRSSGPSVKKNVCIL
jgi:hypothetical protein